MDAVAKRYALDTNVLNKICRNTEDEINVYLSKDQGYEYYFTDIQSFEAGANILKQTENIDPELVERARAEFTVDMLRIITKLQTKHINQIATLYHNSWILDGTYDLLPNSEENAYIMFQDILHSHYFKYINDAMIALTAIINGCVLVTDDKRLYNKVNKHFPGRAIRYVEFIKIVKS